MQYSFKCPACGEVLTVSAPDRASAVEEMMKTGEEHSNLVHAGVPMDPTQMRHMVEASMQEETGVSSDQQVASMNAPTMGEPTTSPTSMESELTSSMGPAMSETPTATQTEPTPIQSEPVPMMSSSTTSEPTNDGTNQGGSSGGVV